MTVMSEEEIRAELNRLESKLTEISNTNISHRQSEVYVIKLLKREIQLIKRVLNEA